jgi:pyrroline-5-carboxylate reductase
MKGAAGTAGGGNIGFADSEAARAEKAAESLGGMVFASNIEGAEKSDVVFLAVKPQVLELVLDEIAPAVQNRLARGDCPVVVSMAPGWPIRKIQNLLDRGGANKPLGPDWAKTNLGPAKFPPVIRIMPNTPALISRGVIAMAPSPEVPSDKIEEIRRLLSGAGMVDLVEEKYLDAVTGLSGSGPAFVYLFIEALADGGVQAGLSRDKALSYAAQTVLGAAAMVQETGKHPGELKDMVCSPGGTTIAGINVLENGAFRASVMNAVYRAYQRAGELG